MTSITSIEKTQNNNILNIFLVDKTGSMDVCAQQTVSGFKEFKNNMKKNVDPNICVEYALGLFDVECNLHEYKNINEIPDLVLAKDYEKNKYQYKNVENMIEINIHQQQQKYPSSRRNCCDI